MPFTHIDIQHQRRSKSTILFIILVVYYFLGFVILGHLLLFSIGIKKADFNYFVGMDTFYLTCLATALTLAAIHWLHAIIGGVERILTALHVEEPDPLDRYHKQFINVIEEIKLATGFHDLRPVVIPTLAVNAFAISTKSDNAVIGVTEGLLARLTRPQLENVVAHEMSHIINNDCVMVTIACSLFATYAQMLRQMADSAEKSQRGAPWLWVGVLALLTLGAKLLNVAISRQREYLADATAVRLTRNPIGLTEAMLKISRNWRGVGYMDESMAPIFIMNPMESTLDENTGFWSNILSTHPPLNRRLSPLLELAHSDIETISNNVEFQLKARQEIKTIHEAPESIGSLWWVQQDNQWKGPFPLAQLGQMTTLKPDSWVCRTDNKNVVKVSEVPEINKLLTARESLSWGGPNCPRCKQPLSNESYEGTKVFHCRFCEGYLIYENSLFKILARREIGFTDEYKKKIKDYQKTQLANSVRQIRPRQQDSSPDCKCPVCSVPMNRTFYSYQYQIVIDRCYSCKLTWFDKNELDFLQIMLEEKIV